MNNIRFRPSRLQQSFHKKTGSYVISSRLPKSSTNKFNARKCEIDGIKFDSLAEGEMYNLLKADASTAHIDCHVPVTLPGGIRLNVDFIVYKKDGTSEAIEVKGKVMAAFPRMRKLFDAFHALKPMKVFKKKQGKWINL